MSSVKFLLNKIRRADYRKFFETAKRISEKTGRNRAVILADIVACIAKYGTGYVDYESFEMYDMPAGDRAGILSIAKNNELVKELNTAEFRPYFEDKARFNEKFGEYLKREWMVLDGKNRAEFKEMFRRLEYIIVKPLDESCGRGIEKLHYGDTEDLDALYSRLYSQRCVLVEEVVIQHPGMDALCSTSINTIRLVTIYNSDDDVNVVAGAIRMGRDGNYVDNFNHGGLAVILDVEKGESVTDGYDKQRNMYKTVPGIGTVLKGFKPPMWNEAVDLVCEAARVIPQVRYVAWDVAVSKDRGVLLIEGNSYPGQDVTQYPKLGVGTYAYFKRFIR